MSSSATTPASAEADQLSKGKPSPEAPPPTIRTRPPGRSHRSPAPHCRSECNRRTPRRQPRDAHFAAIALAASVYVVYVLEILKFKRLRAWQLARLDPDRSEHQIAIEIERELETGEFDKLEPSVPQPGSDATHGSQRISAPPRLPDVERSSGHATQPANRNPDYATPAQRQRTSRSTFAPHWRSPPRDGC